MKQYRTRDIVGDIRNDAIFIIWGDIFEYILMMDRYWGRLHERSLFSEYHWSDFLTHESLIEDLDHIGVELDHIERLRMMREYVLCERTISRSNLDDMFSGYRY